MEMKKESDFRTDEKGESYKEDNLDAPIRLMDKMGKGKELYDRLVAYKKNIIAVLNDDNLSPDLKAKLKDDIIKLENAIPINVSVPKGREGQTYSNDAKGWTTNYFHMTPTIAALTILSKFQNDVKNAESQVVDFCHSQIGQVKLVYDKFQAIATANTSYAMPDEDIEITAGVGAFSASAKPTISIGGQVMSLNADGTAVYKTKATGSGSKTVAVRIEYTKPDGTKDVVNKEIKYTVGMPSGVAVSPNKMNVLYIGVENPLTITAGVGSEKVNATFANGEIRKVGGSQWVVIPKSPGEYNLNVIIDGNTTPMKFRVKRLPDPVAIVGGKRGGNISAAEFKAQGGMIAKLMDSDFDAPFKVLSYSVGAIGGKYSTVQSGSNTGNRWAGTAGSIIDNATPGTTIFFDNIKVQGPDGPRDIPQISFNLK